MLKRPGNISDFEGLKPRRQSIKFKSFNGFGAYQTRTFGYFGKGIMLPPPAPAGGPPPNAVPLSDAINASTGHPYMQDPQCPEGHKLETRNEPCEGMDCCDAPGDCDPPGTVYPETGCFPDPNYKKLLPPPPGGFPDCDARKAAGYPDPCTPENCPSCFQPKPEPAQAQAAAPQAAEPQSAEQQAMADAEAAKLAAELEKLEMEHAQVESLVTQTPTLPPPSSYTGSPMPVMTQRAVAKAPSREEQVASIIQEYELKKAVQRSSAPPPIIRTAPPIAPTPGRVAMTPATATASPATPAPLKPVQGLFSWLQQTLFGTSNLGGWGFGEINKTSIAIPLLIAIGLICYFKFRK